MNEKVIKIIIVSIFSVALIAAAAAKIISLKRR